jgi:hypothetical protein
MKLDRRFLLRGSCQGALAVMGLPFLDCFLDSKGKGPCRDGTAASHPLQHLLLRLRLTKQLWIPKAGGKDYEMTVQLKPLEKFRSKLNVFSGLRVPLDDNPNYQHWSGVAAAATGISPTKQSEFDSKSIDQQIADVISHGARFKSVSASAAGDPKQSYSQPGRRQHPSGGGLAAFALYPPVRAGFQDPHQGDWKPRSADHDPAERAVGGGREPQGRDEESGRRRQGAHGTVFHLGA